MVRSSSGPTITVGTLQLGDGGTSGSIIGDILNDDILALDHADLLPIFGTMSGIGTAVVLGDNSYTGPTSATSRQPRPARPTALAPRPSMH